MNIKCGLGTTYCPEGLDICCGTCEKRGDCGLPCASEHCDDPVKCPDAEVVATELVQFQSAAPEVIEQITQLVIVKKQLEDEEKQLKAALVKAMEKYGVKVFENDQIKMTYVAPTTRSTIDSAKLKKDFPDIAERYTKTSGVVASVRIAVK